MRVPWGHWFVVVGREPPRYRPIGTLAEPVAHGRTIGHQAPVSQSLSEVRLLTRKRTPQHDS